MIPIVFYTIGFVFYCAFCLVTFDVYSKKREHTNPLILSMIFVYYSILAAYIVSIMETSTDVFVLSIEILIYVLGSGFLCFYYYNTAIRPKDSDYEKERNEF